MTDYFEMMERADRAMHDIAQLHLSEFGADHRARDPMDKWGAGGGSRGRYSRRDRKGQKVETGEDRSLNGVIPQNAD